MIAALFIAACAVIFASVFVLVLIVTPRKLVSYSGAVFRARDFVTWSVLTWQTIVQVGKRGLFVPETLQRVYGWLAVFELDSSAIVHPDCYSTKPFMLQLVLFSGSLVLVCVAVFGGLLKQRSAALLRRYSVSLLVMLYPLVSNSVLKMLHCKGGVSDDGSSGPRLVLDSNPLMSCWSGDHLGVGVLAGVVGLCHVIGFPLVSFVVLWRREGRSVVEVMGIDDTVGSDDRTRPDMWALFTAGDYTAFWYAHVSMGVLLVLSVLVEFFPAKAHASLIGECVVFGVTLFVIVGYMVLLLVKRPYNARKKWKAPVKLLACGVTLAGCTCNLVYSLSESVGVPSGLLVASWYCVMCLCGALLLGLLVSFGWSLRAEVRSGMFTGPALKAVSGSRTPLRGKFGSSKTSAAGQSQTVNPLLLTDHEAASLNINIAGERKK